MIPPDRNPTVREWNDSRDTRRAALPITPMPPADRYFRHWPIVAGFGLLVLFVIVLLWPGSVGAAERPRAEAVEIARVTGDAGFYGIALADGRVMIVVPPRSRTRTTPAPQLGSATMTATTVMQNGYSYARVRK